MAGGTGSIPGRGTKMPHAVWCGQKLKLKQNKHTQKHPRTYENFLVAQWSGLSTFTVQVQSLIRELKSTSQVAENKKDKRKKSCIKGKSLCGSMYRNHTKGKTNL